MIAPNPDFAAVTRRFIMEMPIAAHFGFDLTDIQPGFLEVTQPYRRELSFRDGMFQTGAVGTIADFAGAGPA
jgi:acyl-coenzyme A thioesterase PaaI-like protein